MPQFLSAVYIDLVFSTKAWRPFLRDKPTREALHPYPAVSPDNLVARSSS